MRDYKISFWNYEKFNVYSPAQAVNDWIEGGFNTPMTFTFNAETDKVEDMLKLLDECHKYNIKAILCDRRINYHHYALVGEEAYREKVKLVVKSFCSHPALYALFVGDEPNGQMWETAIRACTIVREESKDFRLMVNMFSSWLTKDCAELVGANHDDYKARLIDFVQRTGLKNIAFDCYCQCDYGNELERDFGKNEFIRNFHIFSDVAQATDVELFVSLLSVGHWNYKVPNQDEIRWQMNVAVGLGAVGIFWFFLYQRYLEENYRGAPINLFGEKTEMFRNLSFQNRLFAKYYAEALKPYKFDNVRFSHKPYGGYELFKGKDELKDIESRLNPCPLIVTRWEHEETKKIAFTIVNFDNERPTKIYLTFEGALAKQNGVRWLAPGQLLFISEDEVI